MLHFHTIWLLDSGIRTMHWPYNSCSDRNTLKITEPDQTSKALTNSPDSTPLAGFWEGLDPHQTQHPATVWCPNVTLHTIAALWEDVKARRVQAENFHSSEAVDYVTLCEEAGLWTEPLWSISLIFPKPSPALSIRIQGQNRGGKVQRTALFSAFPTKLDPVFMLISHNGSISEPRWIIQIMNTENIKAHIENCSRWEEESFHNNDLLILHVIPSASILPADCDESETNPCGGVKHKEEFSNAVPKWSTGLKVFAATCC